MLIIKYDEYGEPINDFKAIERVKDIIYNLNNFEDDIELHVCSDSILSLIQAATMHKLIPHDKVKLFCNGVEIGLNSSGQRTEEMQFRMGSVIFDAFVKRGKLFE